MYFQRLADTTSLERMYNQQMQTLNVYSFKEWLYKCRLPIIPVKIEDKYLCFIIDTGSTCSLIDSNVVEYFKDIVTPVGDYNISGIDGTKHRVDVVILPFSFEERLYKPKFCVKPLFEAFKDIEVESGIQVHGLLGTDFLLENKWIVDFNELTIEI